MICQPVIFKKAKKVGEDFEWAGNEGNADLNVHARLHAVYMAYMPIYGRNRFVHGFVGKMKEK